MTQHDFPHSFVTYGVSTTSTSVDARVRPNLRLAFLVPSADHVADKRFAVLLDALAQRTGHGRQIASENLSAL